MKTVAFDGRDRFFKLINSLLLMLVIASILLPVLYILAASFMDPTVLINQGISLDVSDWTTMADGVECYGINFFEEVNGKQRFRGTFYVALDGSAVYSKDDVTGEFVERLPR